MTRAIRAALVAAVLIGFVACSGCEGDAYGPPDDGDGVETRPVLDPTYRPSGHGAAGDVFVHLFEWPWPDVAAECETVLGPAGYAAVQVSPPQEHIVLEDHPWWVRYQPVSYDLVGRSGTRAELVDMVERCAAAGVAVYVDAVLNHMTAGSGVGSNGTVYTKYEYPGLYTPDDFHPACTVSNYQSAANVQDCELLGLADLDTGQEDVRAELAGYLVELVRLGVAGFRLDAAKHMQPVELDSILDRVNQTVSAEGLAIPYYFAEVIDHGGEAVEAGDYFGLAYGSGGAADITEFRFRGVGDKFLGDGQSPAELDPNGPAGARFTPAAWGLIPSDKAVVFLQNHDTQRGQGVSYRDGDVYRLANVFMLAQPYGYPKVMSGYAFERSQDGRDRGPPSESGTTLPVSCVDSMEKAVPGDWVCEHRDPVIAGMVGFGRAVAGTPIAEWWDNGARAIAFSRGDRGFVAINAETDTVALDVTTELRAGPYCDVLTGGVEDGSCVATTIEVDSTGTITVRLPPGRAVALHADARP